MTTLWLHWSQRVGDVVPGVVVCPLVWCFMYGQLHGAFPHWRELSKKNYYELWNTMRWSFPRESTNNTNSSKPPQIKRRLSRLVDLTRSSFFASVWRTAVVSVSADCLWFPLILSPWLVGVLVIWRRDSPMYHVRLVLFSDLPRDGPCWK